MIIRIKLQKKNDQNELIYDEGLYEEFPVNFYDLELIDINALKPYHIPFIIFKFSNVNGKDPMANYKPEKKSNYSLKYVFTT